ncbi:MAG: 50S ribosomal protein L4 [Planctomycetes bacterium]|nr:50S ribosomal protein L4 [Planctomycetota bacterium]
MEVQVFDKNGVLEKPVSVSEDGFGGTVHKALLRDAVLMYEANLRDCIASSKTRSEVSGGGGRKPWAQKHTGRARAGTIRSPLWKGGGIIFGPRPRDYRYTMPRKAKKVALYSAILGKLKENEVMLIEELVFERPSTKKMITLIRSLGIQGSCLLVMQDKDEMVWKSTQNIYDMRLKLSSQLCAYDVVKYQHIVMTVEAFEWLKKK